MLRILFAGPERRWAEYREAIPAALRAAGIAAEVSPDVAPEDADWVVYAPDGPRPPWGRMGRAKGVLSLYAGVERVVGDPELRLPLARMGEEGLVRGMVEWTLGHALRHHLGMDRHLQGQDGVWRRVGGAPPLATERPLTVLGLGALGLPVAQALAAVGFPVTGWSRTPKAGTGLARALAGGAALDDALRGAQGVVLVLPLTPDTTDLMDARRLRLPAPGFFLLNPGRGALVDDAALLAALDGGAVGHATLDVFRQEPLPPEHPFWAHPKVTVTPHVAAETRVPTAAAAIAENVRRGEAGLPLLRLVDRARGY